MKMRYVVLVLVALVLGLGCGYIVQRWNYSQQASGSVTEGDYRKLHKNLGSNVVLYSLSTCPFCKQARSLLIGQDVNFVERVIDKSVKAEKEAAALGIKGVPVLYIGRYRIQGYKEAKILEALGQ